MTENHWEKPLRKTVEELKEDHMISELCLSPDTGTAFFLLKEIDVQNNTYRTSLYCQPVGKAPEKLAEALFLSLCLSESGKLISARREAGGTVLEVWPERKTARQIRRFSQSLKPVSVDDNGFGYYTGPLRQAAQDSDQSVTVSEEYPVFHNDSGLAGNIRNAVWQLTSGDDPVLLTEEDFTVRLACVDPKQKLLAAAGCRYESAPSPFEEVRLYDLENGGCRRLLEDGVWSIQQLSFRNGSMVFAGFPMGEYAGSAQRLLELSPADGSLRVLSDEDRCYGNTVVCDFRFSSGRSFAVSGETVYSVFTRDEQSVLAAFREESGWQDICTDCDTVDFFAVSQQRIVWGGIRNGQRHELYEVAADGSAKAVSAFNLPLSNTEVETLEIQSGGFSVRGFVLPPAGKPEAGISAPAVLMLHGGPRMAFGRPAGHDMRLLSAVGAYVIWCNPRGSDGRGSEFYDLKGYWGSEVPEIEAFVREAVRKYPIDPGRIGVWGGSYGGYLTNCLIARSRLFRAAVSERSISFLPWQELFSDLPDAFRVKQFRRPKGDPMKGEWRGFSPLEEADHVTAPTLFIQAEKDYRCPQIHGEAMFRTLKRNGVPTRIVIFKGENHGVNRIGKPLNRIRRLKEAAVWFDRYLFNE